MGTLISYLLSMRYFGHCSKIRGVRIEINQLSKQQTFGKTPICDELRPYQNTIFFDVNPGDFPRTRMNRFDGMGAHEFPPI